MCLPQTSASEWCEHRNVTRDPRAEQVSAVVGRGRLSSRHILGSEGGEALLQLNSDNTCGEFGELTDVVSEGTDLTFRQASFDERLPHVLLKHRTKSLRDLVDCHRERVVFIEDLGDGNAELGNGRSNLGERFVLHDDVCAIKFDKARGDRSLHLSLAETNSLKPLDQLGERQTNRRPLECRRDSTNTKQVIEGTARVPRVERLLDGRKREPASLEMSDEA